MRTAINQALTLQFLRTEIVGGDTLLTTPFGQRLMLYADYTASGRSLHFIESYLYQLQQVYANTHSEDDITGRTMTHLLHEAEVVIKKQVNAGPDGIMIATGNGATGAIQKMQQITGVELCPATRLNNEKLIAQHLGDDVLRTFQNYCHQHQPVVFVGPYEHHSNEVSWRESLASVVVVCMSDDGGINLPHLESLLADPKYQGRQKIGSFSAASNVTGILTPVSEIAMLLHRYDALALFDYAACAPYVEIDMNPISEDGDCSLDAVFISPHKFLGGPGSSGILVFNQRCYKKHLPPTIAGGGTVDFVGPQDHDFIKDIESREKAGTPGILQTIKAALAFEVKATVSTKIIMQQEKRHLKRVFERWCSNSNIEILGNQDPERRIAIVSFNLKSPDGKYLHPRFVTSLLNDLFAIQSRAGCSCAGPYGHVLLNIDTATANCYRSWVLRGYEGIKPGWCRVSFHYVFDDIEVNHLIDCIEFVAAYGYRFLPLYNFDLHCGEWQHMQSITTTPSLVLQNAMKNNRFDRSPALTDVERANYYHKMLYQAEAWLDRLPGAHECNSYTLSGELGKLQFFSLLEENLVPAIVA